MSKCIKNNNKLSQKNRTGKHVQATSADLPQEQMTMLISMAKENKLPRK